MTPVVIILFCWYLLAFVDAVRFGKGSGEDCYEVWHIAKWVSFWAFPLWYMWVSNMNWKHVCVVVVLSFAYNRLYLVFRALNVYQWDDRYRIPWLGKILGRGGII
jgi:hypothetical protein